MRQALGLLAPLCQVALVGCSSAHREPVCETLAGCGIDISYSPIHSAYDGVHTFQMTPFLREADPEYPDPIEPSTVRWSIDEDYVTVEDFPELPAGLLLTTKKAGEFQLGVAATTRGGLFKRSQALVKITDADPSEWQLGDELFHEGAPPVRDDLDACGIPEDLREQLPKNAACANCHEGESDLGKPATPTRLAFFGDDDIITVATRGAHSGFTYYVSPWLRNAAMPNCAYERFHTYDLSPAEQRGLVLKLRSLQPQPPADYFSTSSNK